MFCSNCGKQIPDNSRFCENCGSRIGMENTLQPPRREPQRITPQSHVEEETFTESPKKSKKSKKPGFISTVLICTVISVGVWFLKGFLGDGELGIFNPSQNQQPSQTDKNNSAQPSRQQSVQTDPLPAQTDAKPVQGDKGQYDVSGIKGIEDIGADNTGYIIERLSTYDRPTLEEFAWYAEVLSNGVWSDATPVTELPYILGGWKCYIVYNLDGSTDSEVQELANVELSIGSGGAFAWVDWYQIFWDGDAPDDETDQEDTEFVGSYENGVFELTGPGNLIIDSFYEYRGKYYGFGFWQTPDGNAADFWLMR